MESLDILLLDEPTNDLDAITVTWLADFLADFDHLVIVVSHDRYFLDMVCTHVVDIDYNSMRIFTGKLYVLVRDKPTHGETAVKSEQESRKPEGGTSGSSSSALVPMLQNHDRPQAERRLLEKLNIDEIRPSTRKYPFIHFKPEREAGDQILKVEGLDAASTL